MKIRSLPLIFLLLCTGCISHFRYESHGTVIMTSGKQTPAAMYWFEDDGRLWYLKRYRSVDSGLELNVCNATSKQFTSLESDELGLPSKGGDVKTASLRDRSGSLVEQHPVRVRPGSVCGRILVDEVIDSLTDLMEGQQPKVAILCANETRPDRYPKVGIYQFESIVRTKIKDNSAPRLTCPEQN